jgi:serine/threonine-protein kinase RsbW
VAPPPRILERSVPAVAQAIEPVRLDVLAFLASEPLSDSLRYRLELILEETLMNRAMHAHPASDPLPTELTVEVDDDGLTLTFVDDGVPFDPLAPRPAPTDDLGGRGLMLTLRAATLCGYAYRDGRNVFTARLAYDRPAD